MFVKQNKSWKGTLLTFTVGYRENGKIKHKNIETIGYLEDLKKQYDDPISYFKQIAKEKSNAEVNELVIKNIKSKTIEENAIKKNLGYIVLKKLYNELNLKSLFNIKQSTLNISYNLNDIFEFLLYSRILYPGSKKETFENKDIFFDDYHFSLKDLYRSLDFLPELKKDIEALIWKNTKDKYNRDVSSTYYDCTNYYFEISYNDEDLIDEEGNILEKGYRKKGPSKEHRKTPIVSLGLLMDKSGFPLSYDLFPGNESEKQTLLPILKRTKAKFKIDRTIIVADRGLNTSDNTVFIAGKNNDDKPNHDGYVYGQSVLGADNEFKDWILNQQDYESDFVYDEQGEKSTYRRKILTKEGKLSHYEDVPVIFKHKSRVFGKTVQILRDDKRKNKFVIYQKQMAYYSQKYADKQKYDREKIIEKAKDLIANPGKYNKSTSYGCSQYINNIKYVKDTGEVAQGQNLSLKLDKIKEEEKFDGYYSIVTSEKNLTDIEIRNIYKGLWEIEETFKISKTNLETRPIYVWTKEHIEAHFLTCFVALIFIRLLESKTKQKYSPEQLINSLKSYTSTKVEHDIYLQDFRNECLKSLEKEFGIDLSRKYLTLSEIKKSLTS